MAVETHDDAMNSAGFGEELMDLFFGGVKGQVANVQGGTFGHVMNELVHSTLKKREKEG